METGKTDPDPLISEKRGLRLIMETRRAGAFAQNPQAPFMLCETFLKNVPLQPKCIIASYVAHGSEIDPAPLNDALRALGHSIALPVMAAKDGPLHFRIHDGLKSLVPNRVGIHEPDVSAVSVVPDVLLVPLLAFDRKGGRLGTGGGYYDRTLEHLRRSRPVLAIGLGFSVQELPVIPQGPHDALLDRIITEIRGF